MLSSLYRGDAELHRRSIGADLAFGRLWAEAGCRDDAMVSGRCWLKSLLADRRFSHGRGD